LAEFRNGGRSEACRRLTLCLHAQVVPPSEGVRQLEQRASFTTIFHHYHDALGRSREHSLGHIVDRARSPRTRVLREGRACHSIDQQQAGGIHPTLAQRRRGHRAKKTVSQARAPACGRRGRQPVRGRGRDHRRQQAGSGGEGGGGDGQHEPGRGFHSPSLEIGRNNCCSTDVRDVAEGGSCWTWTRAAAMATAAAYLEKHGIRDKLCELTREIAVHQPSNPHEHLDAVLARIRNAGASKTAPCARMEKLVKLRETWAANREEFDAWLRQTPEEALEQDLEIVDPHHHLWDMRELSGFNLFGIMRQQYYMTEELLDDCLGAGHNVTHTVFVQTHSFFSKDADEMMAPLGEVEAIQGISAQFRSGKYGAFRGAAAIVGSADLAKFGAEVEPLLVACKAASPNFRGIRVTTSHDPNLPFNFCPTPGLLLQPKFREGFALLEKHGLVFDAFLFSAQLGDLRDLAVSFPTTTIVLNHLGCPVGGLGNHSGATVYEGKQADILESWKAAMVRIASDCPNVYVKVGGCGFPLFGAGWDKGHKPPGSEEVAQVLGHICLWTIETFGAARCMFEGNFPVDKVSMSYTVLWNAFKRITAELPASDRALLFSGTAKQVYSISTLPSAA